MILFLFFADNVDVPPFVDDVGWDGSLNSSTSTSAATNTATTSTTTSVSDGKKSGNTILHQS